MATKTEIAASLYRPLPGWRVVAHGICHPTENTSIGAYTTSLLRNERTGTFVLYDGVSVRGVPQRWAR